MSCMEPFCLFLTVFCPQLLQLFGGIAATLFCCEVAEMFSGPQNFAWLVISMGVRR